MSNLWFNLRIAYWHIQCEEGYLLKFKLTCNSYWKKRWLQEPIELYEFNPILCLRKNRESE